MEKCLFCEIVNKSVPTYIVYEDDFSVGFLDIRPRSKGMTIVAPKQHFENFEENVELATKIFQASLVVAKKIKDSLNPLRVEIASMQSQIPHFHLRLYPVYEDQIPLIENKPIETNENELRQIAESIKSIPVLTEEKKEEIEEEKVRERTKEEIEWIKKQISRA